MVELTTEGMCNTRWYTYHTKKPQWSSIVYKKPSCVQRELSTEWREKVESVYGNPVDKFTMCVMKDDKIVGN